MRTTLARQLRRICYQEMYGTDPLAATITKEGIEERFRAAHPRKPKQKPAKEHRRSRNRRGK